MHDFITEFKPDFADDEIDLGELFTALWRGKWLIFSLCCVALMLASIYLRGSARNAARAPQISKAYEFLTDGAIVVRSSP